MTGPKKRGPKGPRYASHAIVLDAAEHLVRTQNLDASFAIRKAIDPIHDFATTVNRDDGKIVADFDLRQLIRPASKFHSKLPRLDSKSSMTVATLLFEDGDDKYEDNSFEPCPPNDWPPGCLHPRDTVVEQLAKQLRARLRKNPI